MQKYGKLLIRTFVLFFLLLSVVSASLLFGPYLLGMRAYKITSSSMKPIFTPGDIIYIRSIQPEKLRKNNIITFRQTNTNCIITHRVSRMDTNKRLIYTIGDQNSTEDPEPIGYDDVIGVYADYKIPNLFK